MPNVLQTPYYHDDFQIFGEAVIGAITSGTAFFYADRDIVIDSVTYGVSVAGASGSTLQLVNVQHVS